MPKQSRPLVVCALSTAALLPLSSFAQTTLQPIKTSLEEESFQTELVMHALKELGYELNAPETMTYAEAYQYVAANSEAFFAAAWLPTHQELLSSGDQDGHVYVGGSYVPQSAQGYQIDKATADKHQLSTIDQLKDPAIAKLFDHDGNGKAELIGCQPDWVCSKVIDHQIKRYGLSDTVEQIQGDYNALMDSVIEKQRAGKSVLYYTWTPHWISYELQPGKESVWLEVPFSALPEHKDTTLPHGKNYGFEMNSQRIVANKELALAHPDIHRLFEIIQLKPNEVSAENHLLHKAEKGQHNTVAYMQAWIAKNRALFDSWIEEAKRAKQAEAGSDN